MTSTFMICNAITGECTVEAMTPEMIEKQYVAPYLKQPRGIEWVIAEIPLVYGINIYNYRNFPRNMIFDGVALYAKRKAAT